MKRIVLIWMVLTGAVLVPSAGFAQVSCSREGLLRAVDHAFTVLSKGPLATFSIEFPREARTETKP
jgi:hypothetical protein